MLATTKTDQHGWRITSDGTLAKNIGEWLLVVLPAEPGLSPEWSLEDIRYESATLRVVAHGTGISDEDAKISALAELKARLVRDADRCTDELAIIMENP